MSTRTKKILKSLYSEWDCIHPIALGHRIAAEAIADYIFKEGLIK